jgi:hypothetical protein
MITKEQILEATGEELSRLAGEVLCPDASVNCPACPFKDSMEKFDDRGWIGPCQDLGPDDSSCESKFRDNSIPLTWPEAMKWRDWAVKSTDDWVVFMLAIYRVYCQAHGLDSKTERSKEASDAYVWFCKYALPEHYIKAACLCKIGGQSDEEA